eukprot:403375675
MDYGHQEPIMRKSDSPDFFKFNKERKFKPLEYFSPLKSVGQLFPQDQGVGVVGQLKNLEIDQRTLNLIRREFLKYDKESSGKIKIEEFKQIARKICSNEITKYHIKEIVKLFSNQNQNTQVRAHILELLNKLQAKLEQKYADPKSAFRLFDVNNSGDISQEEFQLTLDMIQMDISEDQGLEIFRFLDQNQDGGITLEEFSQIYTESRNRKLQTEFEKRQEINSNMDMFTTISQEDIQSKVSRQSLNKSAVRQQQNKSLIGKIEKSQPKESKQPKMQNQNALEDYLQQIKQLNKQEKLQVQTNKRKEPHYNFNNYERPQLNNLTNKPRKQSEKAHFKKFEAIAIRCKVKLLNNQ